MTETEIRIAVAEAMGWKRKPSDGRCQINVKFPDGEQWEAASIWYHPDESWREHLDPPNYPTDANAALTFCDVLAEKGWGWVAMDADNGVRVIFHKRGELKSYMVVASTLARAICEAGLRCLNLWPDAAPYGGGR